jgi:hypothetical protein
MCEYKENLSHQIATDIPLHMEEYKNNRIAAGLSGQVSIDKCIVGKIKELWSQGIITHGCCCGHHGILPRMVNVADESIQKMIDMDYVMNHPDKTRRDTFELN